MADVVSLNAERDVRAMQAHLESLLPAELLRLAAKLLDDVSKEARAHAVTIILFALQKLDAEGSDHG